MSERPAHAQEFRVVWKGAHYRLASLSWHIKRGIDLATPDRILLDDLSRERLAPLAEIHFCEFIPR